MFQNLRKQQHIYVLYKDSIPRIEIGIVEDVSKPYPITIPNSQPMPYPQMEMVVNVVVKTQSDTLNLKQLLANADISDYGYGNNIFISCTKEAVANEVSIMRKNSVDVLNSVEHHQKMVEVCDKMLSELNPEAAEKQKQEQEISTLKGQMQQMSVNMNQLMEMNKKLMEQLGISETSKE